MDKIQREYGIFKVERIEIMGAIYLRIPTEEII